MCAQMERIDNLIDRKREILGYYREQLESQIGVMLNPESAGTINGAWMPTAVFESETGVQTEELQRCFAAEDIDARVFFHPLSSLPMFEAIPQNSIAYDIPKRAINIPSYHDISIEEQDRVLTVIKDICSV